MNNEIKVEEKSCGCVIFNDGKVLLVRLNEGHWGFPKGHVEGNETEVETARREVKEETNLDVEIDASKRYVEHYYATNGHYKEVVFFSAKAITSDLKKQEEEISEAKWCTPEEALKLITYETSKEILREYMS